VVISDLMLRGLLVFPTAVLLVAAAVAAVWGRGASRWFSMAIGVAVGTVYVAAVVVGGDQRYRVDDLRPGLSSRQAAGVRGQCLRLLL
jgi:hypothetical protein